MKISLINFDEANRLARLGHIYTHVVNRIHRIFARLREVLWSIYDQAGGPDDLRRL